MDGVMKKAQKKLDANVRRSRRNGNTGPSAALLAAKKSARVSAMANPQKHYGFIRDIYQTAREAKTLVKKSTGIVYDYRMAEHHCLWDTNHQERPERFTRVMKRCTQLGLVDRCKVIEPREATLEEILMKHTQEAIEILKATDGSDSVVQLEETSSNYDAVYIHPRTYKLSLLAAGSTIKLIDEICSGNIQNGMAVIRPPGHHAMKSEYCGYCFFNNVAIAAEHALRNLNLSRILIVDWDAHHGQATQQMFYSDPRVVYFSIHRYEYGTFWPNLRESDYDYIGEGRGKGFNFNIPLNEIGMSDADYMAIFQQVLLPMAAEFQPEFIIISAGYDAAIGCPEGEMEVSPACYAHLLTSLMGLANGKIAVVLEGGYCLQSLAEGAALTLRALLGDPCPNLPPLGPPCQSIQDTILNCIFAHINDWHCYQYQGVYSPAQKQSDNKQQHWPQIQYNHTPVIFDKYQTRGSCPVQSKEKKQEIASRLSALTEDTKLLNPLHKVCLVYDPLMMEHKNCSDPEHPEKPERVSSVYNRHLEYGLIDRLHVIKSRETTTDELLLVHDQKHLDEILELCSPSDFSEDAVVRRKKMEVLYNSVYIHPESYKCASLAAGSLLQVVDSVLSGTSGSGVAIVRPPGHHAESFEPCGFCLFNSVAIAAKYAIKNYGLKRILLLDWDVHHGNGTQRIFISDPSVLYISIHRYDRGNFFPASLDGAATVVGSGPGIGFNVNIPWNQKEMGNAEYIAAFHQIILPIAYQFCPELVLISAGFDATVGDPLGGCTLAPEAYAHFTQWLSPLAMGRLILCLEGGYNLTSISYAMTLCTKTLLGDPLPSLEMNSVNPGAVRDIKTVLEIQSKYWSSVCFNKDLPDKDVLAGDQSQWTNVTDDMKQLEVDKLKEKECGTEDFSEAFTRKLTLDECQLPKISMESDSESVEMSKRFCIQLELHEEKIEISDDERKCADNPDKNENNKYTSSEAGTSSEAAGASSEAAGTSSASTSQTVPTLTSFLLENIDLLVKEQAFAVCPKRDCPHLPSVTPVPQSGIDVSLPCLECSSTEENWICLTCYSVHCGRVINEHMLFHFLDTTHPLVLGFADLSVWCYQCDAYIDNPILFEAKNAANLNKFGEPLPKIYG